MNQEDLGIRFKFGEQVEILTYYMARIRGKVKNTNYYIVVFPKLGLSAIGELTIKFGIPNRHLELEWGKYVGFNNEFIISGDNMKKVII